MVQGKRNARGAAVLAVALLAGGCGVVREVTGKDRGMPLSPTRRAPAATGEVELDVSANNNTRIDLEARHLAPPRMLDPNLGSYVAWVRPLDGGPPQNVGALEVNPDDRSAKLETVTPLRDFELFVTLEERGDVREPSDRVVLGGRFRRQ